MDCYKAEYLRTLSEEELAELADMYVKLGFPGCIECLNCLSFAWDNCPVAEKGAHRGEEKKSSMKMEVMADDNLYVWQLWLGTPGVKSDVNILHALPLFQKYRIGAWRRAR